MTETTESGDQADRGSESVYRFRPIGRLLGGELEKQEIYFASPAELNDPMEGYYDVFWRGDDVVWRNLFRHYLMCLDHMYVGVLLGVEKLKIDDIPILLTSDRFPTPGFAARLSSICDRFFSLAAIARLVSTLGAGDREIRRDELLFYLRAVHLQAIAIMSELAEQPPIAGLNPDGLLNGLEEISAAWEKASSGSAGSKAESNASVFEVLNSISAQRELVGLYESPTLLAEDRERFILLDFPRHYLERIEQLCFPPWYTACFVREIGSPALWTHYGNDHTGACLRFRTRPVGVSGVGLRLEHIQGYSGNRDGSTRKIRGFDVLPLERVDYDETYPSLDFFKSLGRLPRGVLNKDWYGDGAGRQSAIGVELWADEEGWRTRYWDTFRRSKIVKLPGWAYEQESRVLLYSGIDNLEEKADRLLRFDLRDLQEIVFGVRTSTKDKLEVMRLAESVCRSSNYLDLQFSQVSYSHATRRFESHPLSLLKLPPT